MKRTPEQAELLKQRRDIRAEIRCTTVEFRAARSLWQSLSARRMDLIHQNRILAMELWDANPNKKNRLIEATLTGTWTCSTCGKKMTREHYLNVDAETQTQIHCNVCMQTLMKINGLKWNDFKIWRKDRVRRLSNGKIHEVNN